MGAGRVTLVDALPERAAALAARLSALFPGRVQSALAASEVLARADGPVAFRLFTGVEADLAAMRSGPLDSFAPTPSHARSASAARAP